MVRAASCRALVYIPEDRRTLLVDEPRVPSTGLVYRSGTRGKTGCTMRPLLSRKRFSPGVTFVARLVGETRWAETTSRDVRRVLYEFGYVCVARVGPEVFGAASRSVQRRDTSPIRVRVDG